MNREEEKQAIAERNNNLPMSLVDYASSSDEDEPKPKPLTQQVEPDTEKIQQTQHRFEGPKLQEPPNNDSPHPRNRNLVPPSKKQMEIVSDNSSDLKLPDASLLLNSPDMPLSSGNASDHSSRVAAAMAENDARKRALNAKPASYPRGKIPKGNLPHSKSVPETVDGRLLPPQLVGRSNVVTEDIGKLFVKKHSN